MMTKTPNDKASAMSDPLRAKTTPPCFLNPMEDVVFRYLFAQRKHHELLLECLNRLLTGDPHQLTSVEVLNPYRDWVKLETYNGVLSIAAKQLKNGKEKRVMLEAMLFKSRRECPIVFPCVDLSYASQRIPMVQVYFLDFVRIENKYEPLSRHILADRETLEPSTDLLEWNFIEVPKFEKSESECKTLTDQWMYFMRNARQLETIPDHVTSPNLKKAYQLIQRSGWSAEVLAELDDIQMEATNQHNQNPSTNPERQRP